MFFTFHADVSKYLSFLYVYMLLFRNTHDFPHILTIGTLPHGNMDWLWKHMLLNDTLKAFDDFKSKQNKAWSNVFWYIKVYIFWKFVQYTIHWAKAKMLKKFLQIKSTLQKMYSFFSRTPTHHSFSFNSRFLYELRVSLCKGVCGIFHFRFVFIWVYIFFQEKARTFWLWNAIIPFRIKITKRPQRFCSYTSYF